MVNRERLQSVGVTEENGESRWKQNQNGTNKRTTGQRTRSAAWKLLESKQQRQSLHIGRDGFQQQRQVEGSGRYEK